MADEPRPTPQPAFMGEWTYNSANTAPPANAQLRLNTSSQANTTAIFVSNTSFNGIDASAWLMEMIPGYVIKLEEKGVPARFHTFTVSGAPIQQSGYVELKVTWRTGGQNLTTSVMVSVISSVVRVTGNPTQANVGSAVVSVPVRVAVTAPPLMHVELGEVDVRGHIYLPNQAFPSDTPVGFSAGMTLRQYYAGQAIIAFTSLPKVTAANLMGGRLAEYCFKLADSMLEFEAREAAGYRPPNVGTGPRNAQQASIQQAANLQVIASRRRA